MLKHTAIQTSSDAALVHKRAGLDGQEPRLGVPDTPPPAQGVIAAPATTTAPPDALSPAALDQFFSHWHLANLPGLPWA